MTIKAKDILLPTEMTAFLRACGKYNLRIDAFDLTIHIQRSADSPHANEQVVRIKHKKSRLEKQYTRHVAPAWTTLFDLDLFGGYYDVNCVKAAAEAARKRNAATDWRRNSRAFDDSWNGFTAPL